MNCLCLGFQKLSSDRQTHRHDRNYIAHRFMGGQQSMSYNAAQVHN